MSDRMKKMKRSVNVGWSVGQSKTLTDVLMDRGLSMSKAVQVCYYVAVWGLYRDALGMEPESADVLALALKVDRRTVFRWQAAFRQAFPEFRSPAVLWEMVKADVRGDDAQSVAFQIGAASL